MDSKQAYEELEKRVAELENKADRLREAEEALFNSEARYQSIFENIQDIYFEVAPDGTILELSPSVEEISGYKREELIGRCAYDLYTDTRKRVELIRELLTNGKIRDYEILLNDKDGSKRFCLTTAKFIRKEKGAPIKTVGSIHNITERKRVEQALLENETRLRAILDASIDRIRHIDKDMKIIWANKTTGMAVDMPPEELVGQTCHKLFVDRDTPCEGCPTTKAQETGQVERAIMHQHRIKGMEGESYWDTYCVPLRNGAGEIESLIQIARDITDQVEAKKHIHTLTQQLMKAQETERQMISRELHDRLGQDLSTIKIICDTLFYDQADVPVKVRQRVSKLSKSLQGVIFAARDLAYDLRPPSLDQLGLVQTVFQYCEDFSEKTGLNVDFYSAGMDELRLDFDCEINLYRLIQEGLNNIHKHAHAGKATIRLISSFPSIILRIEDDGRGFHVQERMLRSSSEKRMGLRSMEERVSLLEGKIRIQSRPGEGTRIRIEVPYRGKKSGSEKNHFDY